MFLPSPLPCRQTIGHTQLAYSPSTVDSQVHCPKLCPLGGFSFTSVLQGCPGGCSATVVPFRWRLPIVKNHLQTRPESPHPLSVDLRELRWCHRCIWETELTEAEWGPWALGPLLPVTFLSLRGLLGPGHTRTVPSGDGALPSTPSCVARWVR